MILFSSTVLNICPVFWVKPMLLSAAIKLFLGFTQPFGGFLSGRLKLFFFPGNIVRYCMMLSADLSSLPTIILRRFLFTNDPAYLLLSVALGDVFLLPPPLLCGILFTLHKKKRKSVPDQSFALSHHTNSSWGATLVSFLMHLPQLLHCYDTGKSDLYQVKPTALF